jgi:hypothetical protein
MKQNEKLLVYLVTGLLVAILGVAVMFGSDGVRTPRTGAAQPGAGPSPAVTPPAGEPVTGTGSAAGTDTRPANPAASKSAPLGLEDILRQELPGRAEPAGGTSEQKPAGSQLASQQGGQQFGQQGIVPGTAAPESILGVPAPAALVREQPLAMAPPTPASAVRDKLGRSERERDYRHVWASRGDTLSSLVLKWCGSVDEYLDLAKSLNEDLVVLKAGQRITLPWVDDEVLLAAFEARTPKPAPVTGTGPPLASLAVEPAAAKPVAEGAAPASADYREYTVKSGDALWTIASKHVGKANAEKFIAQVRELNPGIDVERLRVDQRIKLPGKPPATAAR